MFSRFFFKISAAINKRKKRKHFDLFVFEHVVAREQYSGEFFKTVPKQTRSNGEIFYCSDKQLRLRSVWMEVLSFFGRKPDLILLEFIKKGFIWRLKFDYPQYNYLDKGKGKFLLWVIIYSNDGIALKNNPLSAFIVQGILD